MKTAKLTAKLTTMPKRPQPHGGALNAGGTPGHKGGGGRPPKAFKEFCAAIAKSPVFQQKLASTVRNPNHRHYMAAVRLVAEYGEGLPDQVIDLKVSGSDIRERIASRLARIARARGTE